MVTALRRMTALDNFGLKTQPNPASGSGSEALALWTEQTRTTKLWRLKNARELVLTVRMDPRLGLNCVAADISRTPPCGTARSVCAGTWGRRLPWPGPSATCRVRGTAHRCVAAPDPCPGSVSTKTAVSGHHTYFLYITWSCSAKEDKPNCNDHSTPGVSPCCVPKVDYL